MKDEVTVNMLKMVETSDLQNLMGCSTKVFEPVLNEFFVYAKLEHGAVIYTIQGIHLIIS